MSKVINSNQLYEKFDLLSTLQKETVYKFIEFLISKNTIESEKKKSILLKTSVWSQEDIKYIEDAQKDLSRWTINTF